MRNWQAHEFVVPLPYRQDLPNPDEVKRERAKWEQEEAAAKAAGDLTRVRDARAMVERMTRSLKRVGHLPPGDCYPFPVRAWKLGDAVWLALSGEHYNLLQRELRRRFPGTPIIVGTIANANDVSYVLDKDLRERPVPGGRAVLARGSLETLIDAIADSAGVKELRRDR